ncbi:MAG: hypothetical protein L6R40_002723 [Gallowayella cf. fulva]|nr:MAG: hypothetical protein L6R40_002723 [Xanthomendoza cf. fulva]
MTADPLDELFELEDTFYKEGYDLGFQDGSRAGRIQGRLFGLEKTFEKYIAMGKLHGRAVIWSARLSSLPQHIQPGAKSHGSDGEADVVGDLHSGSSTSLPPISHSHRLEKHIRTLYALTEPASLSTENTQDSLSDFDDRLRRAEGKVKIIEKLLDEDSLGENAQHPIMEVDFTSSQRASAQPDGGIEDISALQARH